MSAPAALNDPAAFLDRWRNAGASERANAQQFLIELADLLGVTRPSNTHSDGYSFEFPVKIPKHDGSFGDADTIACLFTGKIEPSLVVFDHESRRH